VLIAYPEPFFTYQHRRGNITVYSFTDIPAAIDPILDETIRRVSSSPLWNVGLQHRVFLCGRFFPFFAFPDWRAGGVTQVYFAGNVFLRRVDIEHNVLIGRSGNPAGHDRPLSYYLAHEIAHHMTVAHIGRASYRRLRPWQREGYADYLAKGQRLDLPSAIRAFQRGDREMEPKKSGLYDRYRLLVAYALDQKHIDLDALLTSSIAVEPLEEELLSIRLTE
jgi:hypothetical protein